jgi:hypothetical protein
MTANKELFRSKPRSARKKNKGNEDEGREGSIAHSQQRSFKVQLFVKDFNNLRSTIIIFLPTIHPRELLVHLRVHSLDKPWKSSLVAARVWSKVFKIRSWLFQYRFAP